MELDALGRKLAVAHRHHHLTPVGARLQALGQRRIDDQGVRQYLRDVVRGSVEETLNAMLEAEAERLCNAGRYERTEATWQCANLQPLGRFFEGIVILSSKMYVWRKFKIHALIIGARFADDRGTRRHIPRLDRAHRVNQWRHTCHQIRISLTGPICTCAVMLQDLCRVLQFDNRNACKLFRSQERA